MPGGDGFQRVENERHGCTILAFLEMKKEILQSARRLRMKFRSLCVCAIVALAVVMASAQTKTSLSGKCGKADVQQSIPAGDQAGHAFTLAQGKCSAAGKVGGAAGKDGAFSEHAEVTATHMKNWGVFVETFDSGDTVIYDYQGTGTMKDGAFQAGTNKYEIAGGTGKMKGIKGSGSCKLTGKPDGGLDYACTSEYTVNGAAPAKPAKAKP
jgi:hypothetical protein